MAMKRFYGTALPGVKVSELKGKLIVIEGADGSGRSTQIRLLTDWLEQNGHACVNVGLSRSTLVSNALNRAKQGNILSHTTRSLFYATDFADQLENVIIPALRSGFVVLADRYIFTLMARDLVRGAAPQWVESVYSIGIVPDLIFHLKVSPRQLVQRNLEKNQTIDFWEAGMDINLTRDLFDSFMAYQKVMSKEYDKLGEKYGFIDVNGNRSALTVAATIRSRIEAFFSHTTQQEGN